MTRSRDSLQYRAASAHLDAMVAEGVIIVLEGLMLCARKGREESSSHAWRAVQAHADMHLPAAETALLPPCLELGMAIPPTWFSSNSRHCPGFAGASPSLDIGDRRSTCNCLARNLQLPGKEPALTESKKINFSSGPCSAPTRSP